MTSHQDKLIYVVIIQSDVSFQLSLFEFGAEFKSIAPTATENSKCFYKKIFQQKLIHCHAVDKHSDAFGPRQKPELSYSFLCGWIVNTNYVVEANKLSDYPSL